MQGGDNVTAVILKTNGDTMRGNLYTEEISLKLEIGLELPAIYKDKFAKIFVNQARVQAPTQFGIQQPILGESDGVLPLATVTPSDRNVTLDLGKRVTMKLVLIPAGRFVMGSPNDEADRNNDEGPQREIAISKPFYMGIYEVTQDQYEAVMGSNPSRFKGATKPVETVSWEEAMEFCKKLSQKTGRTITLPTEAQWEYACRAGSKTRFCFGDDDKQLGAYASYDQNSSAGTAPVGLRKPNSWGLYDIHGNILEWCTDWHAGSYVNTSTVDPTGPNSGRYRVLRGGCWHSYGKSCRSAYRTKDWPEHGAVATDFELY